VCVINRLVTIDIPDEEPEKFPYEEWSDYGYDDYVEVSDTNIANVAEESFAVGDLEKGDFVLVKLAVERSISHYRAETVSYFHGYEYGIIYFIRPVNTNRFITDTENEYFSILSTDKLQKLLPQYQQSCPTAKHHSCIFQLILVNSV
jgi:hypothetical protein